MPATLLDTTVLIDALRGRSAAQSLLAMKHSGQVPLTTGINVEEVVRGLLPKESDRARRLFDGIRVVEIGRVEGELAGRWRQAFARRGRTLSQADCLIAAAAFSAGAKLATGNPKDFPMKEIVVEHWPVG